MMRELIVVEGKDDIAAVKRAVRAEVVATGGNRFSPDLIPLLRRAQKTRGVILFTDPDYMGERIRKLLNRLVPGCKNAYLPREEALCKDDVGIENAREEAIRRALSLAKPARERREETFCMEDLFRLGLTGHPDASKRRRHLGKRLGIGYSNTKQLLQRLNGEGISPREVFAIVEETHHEG